MTKKGTAASAQPAAYNSSDKIIHLGVREFKIAPLTLQQLIDLHVVNIDNPPPTYSKETGSAGDNLREQYVYRANIVAKSISSVLPVALTGADILAMTISPQDLQDAYVEVLHLAGLKIVGDDKGEANPAA